MTLPNFLICGIQKGGTTALYEYMRRHPDVFCPDRKELCFFDQHWQKGQGWYEAHFEGGQGSTAIGEASPHYMRSQKVATRIRETLGRPKLLFVLRDPVTRAFSNYNYNLGRGQQDPKQSFEQSIATHEGVERYLDKGFYHRDLARFEEVFGRESMLILFAEELRTDPVAVLSRTFRFVGVDPTLWAPVELTSNATQLPRTSLARTTMYRWGQVRRRLQPFVPVALAEATRSLRQRAHQSLVSSDARPTLAPETRAELESHFQAANRQLATWITSGSPLPPWLDRHRISSPRRCPEVLPKG